MNNFAQELPILIFLPCIIIAAVAAVTGFVQLGIVIMTRAKLTRAAQEEEHRTTAITSEASLAEIFSLDPIHLEQASRCDAEQALVF